MALSIRGLLCTVLGPVLGLLAMVASASAVQAQAWATRALCDPPRIAVHDEVFGPDGLDELTRRAEKIPNATGRLWRVTAPGGGISHLWGTMHSSHQSVLDMPGAVLAALKDARTVALEIDPRFADRASFDRFMRGDNIFRPLRSNFRFADLGLPRQIERHLGNRLVSLGWSRDSVQSLTFGALAELMLFDPCEDFAGGVLPTQDSYIQTLAHIAGQTILPLEDSSRLSIKLNAPGNEALARAIIGTYGVYLLPGATPEGRATAFALYQQGRIGVTMAWDQAHVTAALGEEGPALYARMTDYLVDERNVDFVEAALDGLTTGGVFVAVGNFHLPGDRGMIALLRTRGFDVTRVPLPGEAP